MEPYRDRALVVRRYDLGEADRIIVLFTRNRGLVRAVAKGVRRAKSRFGSRLAPFVDVDVNIYPGKGLSTITGADTVHTWAAPLVDNYGAYTCACAALEVAERILGEEDLAAPELWDLTAQALSLLSGAPLAGPAVGSAAGSAAGSGDLGDSSQLSSALRPDLVLTAYILQAMEIAGWLPSLFECAGCGKAGPHHAFSPELGGAVCTHCRPPGADTPATEVLRLMWLLTHNSWGAIDTTAPGFESRAAQARILATKQLQYQLGRRVRALDFVEAS